MWISFATSTITRLRAPQAAPDAHGNVSPDWDAVVASPIGGCTVQPGATDENLDGRDLTLVQWTVIAPGGTDVLATDRIEWQGATYDIDGEPARWPSPTGSLDNVVILLKRTEG